MVSARTLCIIGAVAATGYLSVGAVTSGVSPLRSVAHGSGARTYTITRTDRGFQPESLVIMQGDTVTFVTTGSEAFWPASNPHPSHTILAAFDPRRPLGAKESWSFTFTTPGVFAFHDHLAPAFGGTITVTSTTDGKTGNDICATHPHSMDCWRAETLAAVSAHGVAAGLDMLKTLYQTEPDFASNCHALAHDIGVASYKEYLRNPSSVMTPATIYCASGFFHGFMEALLTATRDPEQAKAFCTQVGKKIGDEAPDAELQCYHGIGHGAMDFAIGQAMLASSTPRTAESLITPALSFCASVASDDQEAYRCNSAVFNSLANLYLSKNSREELGIAPDPKDPLRICREYASPSLEDSCYGNMNALLFIMSKGDFRAAASFIEAIPNDELAKSAIDYLANVSTVRTARKDPAPAVENCRDLQARLHLACIVGYAHGFLENGQPGNEGNEALAYCALPLLHEDERTACYEYVLSTLPGWFSAAKNRTLCALAPAPYQQYCPENLRP